VRRLLLSVALLASVSHAAAEPAAWEVSDGRHSGRLWLLGSVHYLRASDYPLPTLVDTLYRDADELVMELDLDDLDGPEAQSRLLSAAALPAGHSLAHTLGGELYGRLQAKCLELGVPVTAFDQSAPWFVSLNLLAVGLAAAGFAPEYGLEEHLVASAAQDGKAIRGLETLESQIRALAGLSELNERALLAQTLDEIDATTSEVQRLVEAWRNGDVEVLAKELSGDIEQFPGLYDTVVRQRNRRWAAELAELATGTQRYLVLVGALHLVGKDSVVDLLRERGLNVERVR
jgi:uncharacterized protein